MVHETENGEPGLVAAEDSPALTQPGPADPFLEPLVWSIPDRWPLDVERLRRGDITADSEVGRLAAAVAVLHADFGRIAVAAPQAPLQPGPIIEKFAAIWNDVRDELGAEGRWLTTCRPDQIDFDAQTQADFVVLLGQVLRALLLRASDRKLTDLDHLQAYTAQMQADWRALAEAVPFEDLTPGVAVERYNWLLRRARQMVVKKAQHVAQLDDIALDELKRSYLVMQYSLMHLVRAVAFA
jgi:hypothetical protein